MAKNKNLPVVAINAERVRLYYDPDTGMVESYVVDSTVQGSGETWRALTAAEIEANGLTHVIEDTEFGPTIFPARPSAPRG